MAILAAMQSAGLRLIGTIPTTFFGSTEVFQKEICDLINVVADDVAQYRDWQNLIRVHQMTGDGTETLFDLPEDYDRMMLVSDVQDRTNWVFGYYPFADINSYLFQEARGFAPWPGGWIIYEDQMRFSPAPFSGAVAQYPYITKNIAKSDVGIAKEAFDTDTDTCTIITNQKKANSILTLGLIWRWRENKKLDSSGDREAFEKAIDDYASKDTGSRVICRNSRSNWARVGIAWPYELG
jgi:hypothetical protein